MVEERETPAPRPNDKVRKIKGGFPSSVYITDLGGRNKSALTCTTKRQKSRVRQESCLLVLYYVLFSFFFII